MRDTWAEQEQRERIHTQQGGLCYECKAPLPVDAFELAHVIPQRKHWIKKYGEAIIYHDENMRATCPNARCNNAQSIGNNPHLCDAHAEHIKAL